MKPDMNLIRILAIASLVSSVSVTRADEPAKGTVKTLDLGGVPLEVVFIPPGEFMMASTPLLTRVAPLFHRK